MDKQIKVFIDFEAISEFYPQDLPYIMAVGIEGKTQSFCYDVSGRGMHTVYSKIGKDLDKFVKENIGNVNKVDIYGWGCVLERKVLKQIKSDIKYYLVDIQKKYRIGEVSQSKLNKLLEIKELDPLRPIKDEVLEKAGPDKYKKYRIKHSGRLSSIIGAVVNGYGKRYKWAKGLFDDRPKKYLDLVQGYCEEDVKTLVLIDERLSKLRTDGKDFREMLDKWKTLKNLNNAMNKAYESMDKRDEWLKPILKEDVDKYNKIEDDFNKKFRDMIKK